ncbi:major facilitator superfamily domain-containing protein [Dactylonectria macrodidyma]|uniref:Major facilitator superfamily domain-containing protein n=1 Tax=Dactylonectria macrodidyma TaxID=307937 RepID=A0A9P9EQZ3_9HYPO|nr:major facilitator superfamily domain-containing protein [Dactylonectria macrodidyma]
MAHHDPANTSQPSEADPLLGRETASPTSYATTSSEPPVLFPEGGLHGWLAVLSAFSVQFVTFGYITSFGVYETYYLQTLLQDCSLSEVAWIGSIQMWAQLSAMVVSGPLADRYGLQVVIWPSAVSLVLAIAGTSFCREYYQFILCQGLLQGASSGMLLAPVMAVLGHFFHKKRALFMSMASVGSPLGGIVYPIILTKMLRSSSLGFAWTQRVIALMVAAILSVAVLGSNHSFKHRSGPFILFSAFRNPAYAFQIVGLFLLWLGVLTPYFYLAEYALRHNISGTLSTYIFAFLNGGSLAGRLFSGALTLRLGPFNVMILATTFNAILLFFWLKAVSEQELVAFAVLYGATSGAINGLMVSTMGHTAPHPSQIGTYIGMGSSIIAIAGLTGAPITGALISAYGRYTEAIVFSGCVSVLGVCFFMVARIFFGKGKTFV